MDFNFDLRNEIWRYLPLTTRKILGLVCKRYYNLLAPEARAIPVFDMAIVEAKGDAYTCLLPSRQRATLPEILIALHKVGWSPGQQGEGFHTLLTSLEKTNLVLEHANLESFLLLSRIGFGPVEATFEFALQKGYFGLLFYLYYRHPPRVLHKRFHKDFNKVNFTYLAAWCNQASVFKLLASKPQHLELVGMNSRTFLFALKAGNRELIKYFLSRQTDFAIKYAVKHGQLDLLEMVETACFSSWEVQYGGVALKWAVKRNRVDVLEWLHSRGSTWGHDRNVYKEAVVCGQLEPLIWLVGHGYHCDLGQCFQAAITYEHVDILNWLKSLPSFDFQQALNKPWLWKEAIRMDNLKTLKWLVANQYPEKYQTVKSSKDADVQDWLEELFYPERAAELALWIEETFTI